MTDSYKKLMDTYFKKYQEIKKKNSLLSFLRLLTILALLFCVYKFFNSDTTIYIYPSLALLLQFLFLLKVHEKLAWKKNILEKLVEINEDEIKFLENNRMPWNKGDEYMDKSHSYSYDLDIFGEGSLYQSLNRTSTYIGSHKLAEILLNLPTAHEILQYQEAIKEIVNKIDWRQGISALTKIISYDKENYIRLVQWSGTQKQISRPVIKWFSYTLPALLCLGGMLYYFFPSNELAILLVAVPIINLLVVFFNLKKIKNEMVRGSRVLEILKSYSLAIKKIEDEKFNSIKLSDLQSALTKSKTRASQLIKKLSVLLVKLDGINNGLAAILLNSTLLYHLHIYFSLIQWKNKYATHVKIWLDAVGEVEALNSMANYAYNNPSFTYPKLNNEYLFSCKDLGHPLIRERNRITNDVQISRDSLIILTGSNMSGKSTFLRTLGVNLVLAGVGAPICSSDATIHPLKVLTSMRQIDSLTSGESYFFAEVKRLNKIMDMSDHETCFVLLDEILKGTNSDDKHSGTLGVIKKLLSKKAIGIIATHDLEVCNIAYDFPEQLSNYCFEVEIIANELVFDYKLRQGICKNKSATFLMKKMSIIS